jgi:glycosyltransferase involved in cell wall biosynthesis
MRILFVHHYFPGQFRRIVQHYRDSGLHDIIGLHRGLDDGRTMEPLEGIRVIEYGDEVEMDREPDHALFETDLFIREAASAAMRAIDLRDDEDWFPDIVYSHSGWAMGAFIHDVFPDAKYVKYCEWFYNNTEDSTEFLEPDRPFVPRLLTSLMNIPIMADLVRADLMIAPTHWQKSQFPKAMQASINVVPDGIDTDIFRPDPDATFEVASGRVFRPGDRVVTYVARGADPFRGFAQFIAALGVLQAADPDVEAIVVGDRIVYYGIGQGTEDHFEAVMATATVDPSRTHFTGTLDYDAYRRVLQVSGAHVYLTVPFVLSWSALEALSAGCALVGSDTAPVREFVTAGDNGLLADFFDPEDIAAKLKTALDGGPAIEAMRKNARRTIMERWGAEAAVAEHERLVGGLLIA